MIKIDEIREKLTPLEVYRSQYPSLTLNDVKHTKKFLSCFQKEKTPSLSFKQGRNGDIFFNDYSSGKHGDMFVFFAELNNLNFKGNIPKVLSLMNDKYNLGLGEKQYINFDRRWKAEYYPMFTKKALNYWKKFGVSKELLSKHCKQLKLLTYTSLEGKSSKYNYEKTDLIAFEFRVNGRYKLYIPKQRGLDKKYFIKTQTNKDTFGSPPPRNGKYDYLVICEGEKDALVCMANDIPARCLQSANTKLEREHLVEFRAMAKEVIICYDSDEAGIKNSFEISKLWNLPRLQLPEGYKDIAEYLPKGEEKVKQFKVDIKNSIKRFKLSNKLNIWEKNKTYIKKVVDKNKKKENGITITFDEPFTNFIIENQAFIEGEHQSKRIVKLINEQKESKSFAVTTDVFTGVQKFRDFTESKGEFYFLGNINDLFAMKMYVFGLAKHTEEVAHIGYDLKTDAFILSNAIIKKNKVYYPNKLGIVDNIYVPSAAIENRYDTNFGTDRKYIYQENKSVTLNDWLKGLKDCYGLTATILGFSFLFTTLFFDFITQKHKIPLLNLWGQRGSGKNSFVEMLMAVYGNDIEASNLQNITSTALTRKMAHTSNIPQWFDEYNNRLKDRILEALKGIYDMIGRTMGVKSVDTKTSQTKILTSAIITGQEFPTANEALLSRMIIIQFDQIKDDKEKAKLYNDYVSKFDTGLGHVLKGLLSFREIVKSQFQAKFRETYKAISNEMINRNLQVDARLVRNYAVVLSPLLIALENGLPVKGEIKQDFETENLLNTVYTNLEIQANSEAKNDEVNIFWETFFNLIEAKRIKEGENFIIDLLDDEVSITAHVLDQYQIYYRQLNDRKAPDRNAVLSYMKKRDYYKKYTRKRFGTGAYDEHGMEQRKQIKCHVCDISKMPPHIKEMFSQDDE